MIYVDDARHPFGRMVMCHMIADSTEELKTFAWRLGISPKWIQDEGTYREHFDISLGRRVMAVRMGAREITQRDLARMLLLRRARRGV